MLPAPGSGYLYSLNPPAWSLALEAVVNSIYAVLHGRIAQVTGLNTMAVSTAIIVHNASLAGNSNLGADWANFGTGLARAVYSFTAGLLLFPVIDRLRSLRSTSWLAYTLPLLLLALLGYDPVDPVSRDLACILFGFPIIVLVGALIEPPAPKVFTVLGDISYALYCIHFPLLMVGRAVLQRLGWLDGGGSALIVTILAAAAVIHACFDVPVRRWLTHRLVVTAVPLQRSN